MESPITSKKQNRQTNYYKSYYEKNKEKYKLSNQKYRQSKQQKVDLEKKEVYEEKLKTQEVLLKLYEKLDKIERQTAELEVLHYQHAVTSKSSTVIQPEPQLKKKNIVKSQTQEPETIEKLPAEHKKLYEAFKKQQAKTQQAPSTTTTDYESESESEESEFEIDADGNII